MAGEVLKSAARHKLHIQFHGSYKPSGEQRTFPNLFNREGVLNLEYLEVERTCARRSIAWTSPTRGCWPDRSTITWAASARLARDDFKPRDEKPEVMGTRCHQLAMYIVFENPMPMVCDYPEAYEGQPGFDFLVEVPTTWDETRFVAGEPGEYVVVARRSGKNWYLGGMTNWTSRKVRIPLGFLGNGVFDASVNSDVSPDGSNPNKIQTENRAATNDQTLDVELASGGGVAAVFRPKK